MQHYAKEAHTGNMKTTGTSGSNSVLSSEVEGKLAFSIQQNKIKQPLL